jgi:hypothetical protein
VENGKVICIRHKAGGNPEKVYDEEAVKNGRLEGLDKIRLGINKD